MSRRRTPEKTAPRDKRALGEVLGFMQLLWAVAHGLETISKHMGATVGVTGPQRLVLRLVGHFGQLSAGDLAELLHVHPSSLTGVLGRLERARLLHRRRDHEDRRRAVLTLTPAGKRLNDRRRGTVESAVRRTLRATSRAGTAATRRMLKELARELGVEAGAPAALTSAEGIGAARAGKR